MRVTTPAVACRCARHAVPLAFLVVGHIGAAVPV
jgi:hypothetical protein